MNLPDLDEPPSWTIDQRLRTRIGIDWDLNTWTVKIQDKKRSESRDVKVRVSVDGGREVACASTAETPQMTHGEEILLGRETGVLHVNSERGKIFLTKFCRAVSEL